MASLNAVRGWATNKDEVLAWLASLGLQSDPFRLLDAAADPNLSRYLVQHDALTDVWGAWISVVFATLGAGKTALRARTTLACYGRQDTNQPFPIPYVLPFLEWGHALPSLDDHLAAIARAAAKQLLLSLAYRPRWLLRLGDAERQAARSVLDWSLPGPLTGYLELLRQSSSLVLLRERFNPNFVLPDPPDVPTLLHFCDALGSLPSERGGQPSPSERWNTLAQILLEVLGFEAIYVLLDGLDGAPETATDGQKAVAVLAPLLDALTEWTREDIFLKGFLPSGVQPLLQSQFPLFLTEAHITTIHWTAELLAQVIKERVYVASSGAFPSLNAISSPALADIDVESAIASAVVQLPREVLVLTERVLWEHVQRRGPKGLIEVEDLDAAINWYKQNQPAVDKGWFTTEVGPFAL